MEMDMGAGRPGDVMQVLPGRGAVGDITGRIISNRGCLRGAGVLIQSFG